MSVTTHTATAIIDPDGLNLTVPVLSGTLTMDASWTPYTQGSITIPMPADTQMGAAVLNVLPLRIIASVEGDVGNTETWNVHVRRATADHLEDTYTLDFASAEALVQDWGSRISSLAFSANTVPANICAFVLEEALGGDITVSIDSGGVGLDIPDQMRVWPAGTPAWDYVSQICNELNGRILHVTPFGGWTIFPNDVAVGTTSLPIPNPEVALSYFEEWSRDSDLGQAITVQFTGGDPTYTSIAVPDSNPAVSVQVEIRRYGNSWLPEASTVKPVLSKGFDTTTTVTRDHPEANRDLYASYVRHRRENLGYYLRWREVSHYALQPRRTIGDQEMFVDRVSHDFGTNEMSVSARLQYEGDPV